MPGAQLDALFAAHDGVTTRWLDYELDVAKLIAYPAMSDGRQPLTAAFLRAKPGQRIDKNQLIDYMREHLAPTKTPRHWFVLDAFPLTGSGKIQKFKLREQWAKGELTES